MNHMMVTVLGMIMVMLVVFPALAEKTVDAEDDLITGGMDPAVSDRGGQSADADALETGGDFVNGEGCGVDTQSPVLDGGAYSNYDTLFFHGTNAVTYGAPNSDVASEMDLMWGHVIRLHEAPSGGDSFAFLNCPFASYHSKQGDVQPRVRYLGILFGSDPSGSTYPEISEIYLYNGCSHVRTLPGPFFKNSTCSVQVLDLGGYYLFDRGLNMILKISNHRSTDQQFLLGGYGARFEW